MRVLSVLFIIISFECFSQDYVDSIPKQKQKILFGLEQRNMFDTQFQKDYLRENSISVIVKKNEYSFSLGTSLVGNAEDNNNNPNKINIVGPSISASIEIYRYKKMLYIPITFFYNYYRYKYTYGVNADALLTMNSRGVKIAIEYSPNKAQNLHLFSSFGINNLIRYDRYIESNGEVHSRSTGSFLYVIDFGIKVFFTSRSK